MIEPEKLPKSWVMAPISHIADVNLRSFCPLPSAVDELVHFVPMSAVEAEFGGINVSQKRPLGEVQKGYTSFLPDDVLFAKITPCMENGKVAVVPALANHIAFGSTEFHVLRAQDGIRAAWLAYFLSQSEFRRFARQHMTGSAGQLRVSARWLSDTKIPVAPSEEQTRIVEKLEELLSGLDAGVAELKAAQKKIAQYRQSLLKAAVEGSLTAKWRAKNPSAETGAQLLQRILTERRARWEAKQLAKFKEQGKTPPKDWQQKYPEPVQPETTDLPQLPEGWVWASLDMLGEIVSGVAKGTKRDANVQVREVPYLRVANVQRGFLNLSEVKTILATEHDIAELTLQAGDILFNEGGDRDKLGRGWVWRDEVASCIHQNHVFRMRPYMREVLPELISHHGNTFGKTWFPNAGKQTTNLASINMTMLRMFPVPLGPADEQREVLNQLELQIQQIERQEQAVEVGLKQSAAQRKNLLKAAFSGQLVSQDQNDEPASVLLERIRADRIAAAARKHSRARLHTREST